MVDDKMLIDNFINKLYGDNSSKHTTVNYRVDLKFYLKYLHSQNLSITEVNLEQLEGYKAYLRDATYGNGKHYSENTRARRISSLKSFYNYLYERDIVKANPADRLTVPKVEQDKAPIFMTQEQAQKLINATEGEAHALRDRSILTLFLTTGMRLSELVNLNVSDVNGTQIQISKGKGNKSRSVNISQGTSQLIQKYLNSREHEYSEALFTSQQSPRVSESAVQQLIVSKYIKKAGLNKNLSTHKLRHTAATLMLRNNVDLNTIKEILGHSSLKTTQIYMHTQDEDKQNAANVVGNLFV